MAYEAELGTIRTYLTQFPEKLNGVIARSVAKNGGLNEAAGFAFVEAKFLRGREQRPPASPATVPDDMVSYVIQHLYCKDAECAARMKIEHQLSMTAENYIGELLERYIASILEPRGWVWCSGDVVSKTDFIRRMQDGTWVELQIKNRDNSENSSSSQVRMGTQIKKWFRTFSRTGDTNWNAFPDEAARPHMNEEGFQAFVARYCTQIKDRFGLAE